ncbi:MAG: DUF2334 domain-containing protein [Bacteroidota bacterium]
MRRAAVPLLSWCLATSAFSVPAERGGPAKVLIVVEGGTSLRSKAIADGRELATLLGHFNATTRVLGVNEYVPRTFGRYDLVVFIGFSASYNPPLRFQEDVLATRVPVLWLNTGFKEFSSRPEVRRRFGFTVSHLDSVNVFDKVRAGTRTFTKGEPNINMIAIADRKRVSILATALSTRKRWEVPYIVRSGLLTYFADSPFSNATETDRYLLFADMLHDILGQAHEESHTALIRIEDVNPLENPSNLREIADILSSHSIPFLVGVVPFYVSPSEGIRVSLSDKPELVDALRYMTQNGGTIVMHGVTHQYHGITGVDYEFWDENTGRPIREETVEGISRKIEMGIHEFMRNGLYPLVWETPHYAGSFRLYETIGRYFNTAMEQRLAIEDMDYGQYVPYMITRDLFGQRLISENLGYVPLDPDPAVGEAAVANIIAGAKANLAVRDGFAACFFHPFVNLDLLKKLVDGVEALGYTYMDVRDLNLRSGTKDRIMLSGSQEFTLTLDAQYLQETVIEKNGEVMSMTTSDKRVSGQITRSVSLEPGQIYKAEPVEFRERMPSFTEQLWTGAQRAADKVFGREETWREARPVILWNHYARGAAFNDQASFAAVMRSVNVAVDTIFAGQPLRLEQYNLLFVPYTFVDSLRDADYDAIVKFVSDGGSVVTDMPTELAKELGISFGNSRFRVTRVRDRLFPEERIAWRLAELATRFDADNVEEVFCIDEATEAPLVVGRPLGKGKIIFFSTRFDPLSREGYSLYPFLLEYIGKYFRLGPVVRRDRLEVYFEPGSRARTMSTETLIKQWVRLGVRIVHVSGWHEYPKYTYDYKRLITLAHANGILVYAWLEPPQVSPKFYGDHPEWREKNIKGDDVRPSWRYPVAMTDEKCVQAMTAAYRTFLESYDWDGVNIAELYFDAGRGFRDPLLFTPMHPSAQREFRRRYGFDLRAVLDSTSSHFWKANLDAKRAVVEYRIHALENVYTSVLGMTRELTASRHGFQVIVTAMDALGSPELRENIGVDMNSILAFQREYGFVLQVEDPEPVWSTDPLRYQEIGRRYVAIAGDRSKIMLDLNILSFRKPEQITPFPTLIQTGTESFHLVRSASMGAPRLTIYSESSVNPQDIKFFPFALASDVTYRRVENGYAVASPVSFSLKLPPETKEISIDGVPLSPARENTYIIPAGEHTVTIGREQGSAFSTHELETRILSFSGNLLSVAYGMRTVNLTYEAGMRALLTLNREPTSAHVDGEPYSFAQMKGNDCYSMFLPPGSHTVHIVAGDAFSYGVNITSFWSANAIAIFGSIAVLMLAAMYVALKVLKGRYA